MSEHTIRGDVLDTAKKLITGDRQRQYGSFRDQMESVAKMVEGATGMVLPSHVVAMVLICLKVKRINTSHGDLDSEVDLAGYAALYAEYFKSDIVAAAGSTPPAA